MNPRAAAVLHYWFGDSADEMEVLAQYGPIWFRGGPDVDRQIREQFAADHAAAAAGDCDSWAEHARGRLALIILLDQFSRNLYRGQSGQYAWDGKAQRLALDGIALTDCEPSLRAVERPFLYMPLMHAEDLALQDRCCERFRALRDAAPAAMRERCDSYLGYAERHREPIARFGRFPHRNEMLGRRSTPEELAYLAEHGGF